MIFSLFRFQVLLPFTIYHPLVWKNCILIIPTIEFTEREPFFFCIDVFKICCDCCIWQHCQKHVTNLALVFKEALFFGVQLYIQGYSNLEVLFIKSRYVEASSPPHKYRHNDDTKSFKFGYILHIVLSVQKHF